MSKPLSIFIILLVLMSSVAPVLAANYTQDMQDADNWDLVSTLIWIALFIVSIGFIFQVFRNGTFSMIPFDMIIKMLWILIITAIVYILVVYLSDTI